MILQNGCSSVLDGRTDNRFRFSLASRFLSPLAPLIKLGFATRQKGKTAMGRAMSRVLNNAVIGRFPKVDIDISQVRISEGALCNPAQPTVVRTDRELLVRWEADDLQ
nr:DUF6266 family protein [Sphingobacterium sp. xlx-130]